MKQDIDGNYRNNRCIIFINLCEIILSLFDDAGINLHTDIFKIRSKLLLLNKDTEITEFDFDKIILDIEKELLDFIIKTRVKILQNNYNSNCNYHIELNNKNEIVNELKYDRFSNINTRYFEGKLMDALNLSLISKNLTLCVTNSGTASLLLFITLSKHQFIRYNDLILYSSDIYIQSKELLNQEYHCRIEEFNSELSEDSIIKLIVKKKPKLLFLDTINSNNLKRRNIYRILDNLERHYDDDIKVVIDFTLDPILNIPKIFSHTKSIEIFLYSSITKYFQFGLDTGLMGCIISNKHYYSNFDNYRVLNSTILNNIYQNSIPISDIVTLNHFISIIQYNSKFFLKKFNALQLNKVFSITYDKKFKTGLFFLELKDTKAKTLQIDSIISSVINNCNAQLNVIMYSLSYGFTRPSISILNENGTKKIRLWVGTLSHKHIDNILNQLDLVLNKNNTVANKKLAIVVVDLEK
jgi:hypothetical protein